MSELIDEPIDVSTHGIFNWILLLAIFSVITVSPHLHDGAFPARISSELL